MEDAKKWSKEIAKLRRKSTTKKARGMLTRSISVFISNHEYDEVQLAQKAAKFKDEDFEWCRAFFTAPGAGDGSLKLYSRAALFTIFIMLWRRIVLLFSAMFLTKFAWIQMMIFTWFSIGKIFFTGFVMPNSSPAANKFEIMNECFVLMCAYLAITLLCMNHNVEMG